MHYSKNNMQSSLRVLGCSGSIEKDIHTTSFLVDSDILIDAGTGVTALSLEELTKINHVFVTHSHLDHICSIPFIADAVGSLRNQPLKIYGNQHTINALHAHIFNNVIWPDFTKIPSADSPFVTLEALELDQSISIPLVSNPKIIREISLIPANHSIPSNGYIIKNDTGAIFFSGDTGPCPEMWEKVNLSSNLTHVILETSFDNSESTLANLSKHLYPNETAIELSQLSKGDVNIWITHLKPQCELLIMREIDSATKSTNRRKPQKLNQGCVLKF